MREGGPSEISGAFASPSRRRSRTGLVERITRSVSAAAYSLLDFLPEDKAICERGQRGATGDYDVVTGESSFIQRITRRAHPVTYWLIVSTWIVLSVLWIAYPE